MRCSSIRKRFSRITRHVSAQSPLELRRLFARTVYCIRDPRRATVVTVRIFWNRLRFSVRSVLRTRLTVQLYSVYSESSAQQSQYHTSSIKIFCANPTLQLTWLLGLGRTHPCTRNHATMYKFRSWDLESVDDGGAPPSACRRKPCRFSIYRAFVHVCSVTLIQFSDCFLHNHIPC